MLRSIQIKIILIFSLLGIISISALGIFFITKLDTVSQKVPTNEANTHMLIQEEMEQTKTVVIYSIGAYIVIAVIVGFFMTKVIIYPISDLIKTAERIVAGEDVDIKYLSDGKKNSEIDDLVEAFSMMTAEL